MRIHKITLRHVRQFEKLELDVSAPLTVISGPNGTGKTTLQDALLIALFQGKKDRRDTMISVFDPHSPPLVELELSRDDGPASITLHRRLTDNTGSWTETGNNIKQKGKALEQIQQSLPISAEAAAALLWGSQQDMANVLEQFPSDGHSLLATATIRGAGLDPKVVIENLDEQHRRSRRGGKDAGPLTLATQRVQQLEQELLEANELMRQQIALQQRYVVAKADRDEADKLREELEGREQLLSRKSRTIDGCLRAKETLGNLDKRRQQLAEIDSLQERDERRLALLEDEFRSLGIQFRLRRTMELEEASERLSQQLRRIEAADQKMQQVKESIQARRRPRQEDRNTQSRLLEELRGAENKLAATGLRYSVRLDAGDHEIQIGEEGANLKRVELQPGDEIEGVVGQLAVTIDGVVVTARGKEDVLRLKQTIEQTNRQLSELYASFDVENAPLFNRLAEEFSMLAHTYKEAEQHHREELQGTTVSRINSDLQRYELERARLQLSEEEWQAAIAMKAREAVATLVASELEKRLAAKESEVAQLKQVIVDRSTQRLSESQRANFEEERQRSLDSVEQQRSVLASLFGPDFEPQPRDLEKVRAELEETRRKVSETNRQLQRLAEESKALSTELRYAGPARPVATIESEMVMAKQELERETLLQRARELLKDRLEKTVEEMTAHVPVNLAKQVGYHLSRLTDGGFEQVSLDGNLAVERIGENRGLTQHWLPRQLSAGERNQAALAVKLAVAQALTDTTGGPIFIILDDSFAVLDPQRRRASEDFFLELVSRSKLQIILLTCHEDWARDWARRVGRGVKHYDLPDEAQYYRKPVAMEPTADVPLFR